METQDKPQHCEFRFGNLLFSSKIDSGNICAVRQREGYNFEIDVYKDSFHIPQTVLYSSWFHFFITGFPKQTRITINILNLNQIIKIVSQGFRPVFKTSELNSQWQKIPGKFSFNITEKYFLNMTFEHTVSVDAKELTYFALTYPFSYSDCQNLLYFNEISMVDLGKIYFKRELLVYSLENRRVDLLTISSYDKILNKHEELITNLFPLSGPEDRPFMYKKKPTIFLTARVHPGEVQGSHMLNGIINLLLNPVNPISIACRKYFVWKIIPMLNPDGVYNGFFRLDTLAQNLNRFYENPLLEKQPTIYAAKKAILQQHLYQNLVFYIDLHGHISKNGVFIFGNPLEDKYHLENLLFAKLLSLNNPFFDISECNFSVENSKKIDYDGTTRAGSGRVTICNETQLLNCFTLECGFNSSNKIEAIPRLYNKNKKKIASETLFPSIQNEISENKNPLYNLEMIQEFGKSIVLSILDYFEKNPITRVYLSKYRCNVNIRKEIAKFSGLKFRSSNVMKRSTNSMTKFFPKNHLTRSSSSSNKIELKKRIFEKNKYNKKEKIFYQNKATNSSNTPKGKIMLRGNSPTSINNGKLEKLKELINTFNS